MKIHNINTYYLIALFSLGGIFGAAADEPIIFVTGEFPPYVSTSMEGYGFSCRVVSAVAEQLDWEIEYRFYPWSRCEAMIRQGRVFAALPYAKSKEREEIAHFSRPISPHKMMFWKYLNNVPDNFTWNALEDLRPYKVGAVHGYYYIPNFQEAGLHLDETPDLESGLKKLKRGRIDLLPGDYMVVRHTLEQLYPSVRDQFEPLERPYESDSLHLMVSRKYPKAESLLDQFNRGLREIKTNGTYQALKQEYGIK